MAPVESTTTLVMPTTTVPVRYTIAEYGMWPPSFTDDPSIYGSGCSPKSDVLPDGIWFGFVRDIDATTITFDLACLADPPAAGPEGQENSPWSIINGSDRVRAVPVAETTLVVCELADCDRGELQGAGDVPEILEYVDWITHVVGFLETWPQATEWSGGGGVGVHVWLYVNDGLVTEVLEPVLAG
jgi:hypothetical protein